MIFQQVLVNQILAGKKTQTRRPVNFDNPKSHYWHQNCRYQPGTQFVAQANYKPGQVWPRLEVTKLRRETWGDIDLPDALAEGFPLPDSGMEPAFAREAFFVYVGALHEKQQKALQIPAAERTPLDRTAEVYVIEFKRVEVAPDQLNLLDGAA